jgi:ATP synthase protein I
MNGRTGREDGGPDRSPPEADAALDQRLRDLDRRLGESRAGRDEIAAKEVQPTRPGVAMAVRLGADFVAGVALGIALGWGFDKLVGTSPWGLAVGLLFGFAAGLLTVMRSAGVIPPRVGGDGPG